MLRADGSRGFVGPSEGFVEVACFRGSDLTLVVGFSFRGGNWAPKLEVDPFRVGFEWGFDDCTKADFLSSYLRVDF